MELHIVVLLALVAGFAHGGGYRYPTRFVAIQAPPRVLINKVAYPFIQQVPILRTLVVRQKVHVPRFFPVNRNIIRTIVRKVQVPVPKPIAVPQIMVRKVAVPVERTKVLERTNVVAQPVAVSLESPVAARPLAQPVAKGLINQVGKVDVGFDQGFGDVGIQNDNIGLVDTGLGLSDPLLDGALGPALGVNNGIDIGLGQKGLGLNDVGLGHDNAIGLGPIDPILDGSSGLGLNNGFDPGFSQGVLAGNGVGLGGIDTGFDGRNGGIDSGFGQGGVIDNAIIGGKKG